MSLGAHLTANWQKRDWLAVALLPLGLAFAALAALRRTLYRFGVLSRVRLPVPVVVVGNITVGGSGKTPLVLHLAQELARRGRRPGVVSRGYGGKAQGVRAVDAGADPAAVGDEPLLLARRAGCPVFVSRDRVAAARALLAAHPECDLLIADDGLQHLRLARDLELVVMDERGLGNGWPLPAGPLRDWPQRLAAADALILNGASACVPPGVVPPRLFRMGLEGARFHSLAEPERRCSAAALRGKRLHALAGTGNPARFFRQLESLGLRFEPHVFPDHHRYRPEDIAFMGAEAVLMTEKDAVKCQAFAPREAWFLPVEARLDGDLASWVLERLRTHGRQVA